MLLICGAGSPINPMITKAEQNKLTAIDAAAQKIAESRARLLAEIRNRQAEERKDLKWLIGSTLVENAHIPACRAGLEAIKVLLKSRKHITALDEVLNPTPSEYSHLLKSTADKAAGHKK